MTASTPPLVDVIARALAGHIPGDTIGQYADGGEFEGEILCSCGHVTKYTGELDFDDKAHAAHQAAAVEAALTAAGNVEWGVFRKSDGDTAQPLIRHFQSAEAASRHTKNAFLPPFYNSLEPRSRVVGPWEVAG